MTKDEERPCKKKEERMDIAEVLARRRPQRIAKRAMDIVLSAAALAVLWPLLLLIALAVVIDDPGPVFYRQVRIGRGGKPFRIFKFRSMVTDADKKGLAITVGRDSRITRVGAILQDRWTSWRSSSTSRADELRRPAPGGGAIRQALYAVSAAGASGAPGITDYASIAYRNENDLLAGAEEPEKKCTSSRSCPIKSS